MKNAIKAKRREIAVEAGEYDGRFRPKVVKDARKHENRMACRKFRADRD